MRKVFLKLLIVFFTLNCFAQTKPLYKLPDSMPETEEVKSEIPFLAGCDKGLYRINKNGNAEVLWNEGKVQQIVRTDVADTNGNLNPKWFFITSKGIISTKDLVNFEECNEGIPFLTIKEYDGQKKTLVKQAPLLKDLSADPFDQNILVTATKDNVYLTRDGGATWKSLGSMSRNTGGVKSVAVSHMPVINAAGEVTGSELVVFMSHPIYGLSYYRVDSKKPVWTDITGGFKNMQTLSYPDEISDILPVVCKKEDGTIYTEIFLSQSFFPDIYILDWKAKRGKIVYEGKEPVSATDSLCQCGDSIVFVSDSSVNQLSLKDFTVTDITEDADTDWCNTLYKSLSNVNAVYIPGTNTRLNNPVQLNELWLLKTDSVLSSWGEKTEGRKAVYIPANHVNTIEGINKYKKIIKDNNLNALVVDMKDDYGLLRFDPKDPGVKEKCYVSRYKVNIEQFISEFKKDDIYLVARIVAFKDKNLANYGKKQYAVWNSKTDSSWDGIKGTEDIKDEEGNIIDRKTLYYDEKWVDPYSEEVWEYNVAIAKDLIEYGFDEIQFDYIRFPTDGLNLGQAGYRWRDTGMDKESAIVSFLSYARKNINAPIGIDIYGANGWYRTGARTGQDVELLSKYVDVICPMFYPSHFEQTFLNYSPVAERAYRIYYYGTYRNTVIGRNQIVVRPWVQAFYIGVSYDAKYYGKDYVKQEVFGVRDSVNKGYMYWNNIGRYDDICSDISDDEPYPWKAPEANAEFKKPAFGKEKKSSASEEILIEETEVPKESEEKETLSSAQVDMISIMDSVLYKELEEENGTKLKQRRMLLSTNLWKIKND